MVDCGSLPYAQNVAGTADLTRLLHEQGLAVEADLG
jgi:fructose-bisphosphate aldolase class II